MNNIPEAFINATYQCPRPLPLPFVLLVFFLRNVAPWAGLLFIHKLIPIMYQHQRQHNMDNKNSKITQFSHSLLSFSLFFNEKKPSKTPQRSAAPTEESQQLDERAKRIEQLKYRMSQLQQAKIKWESELAEKQQALKEDGVLPQNQTSNILTSQASQKSTAFIKPDNPDDPNYLDQLETYICELEGVYKISL